MRRLPAPRDRGIVFYSGDLVANTKSAEKRNRQNVAARERNRGHRSRLRTAIKRLRAAMASGDSGKVQEMLPRTLGIIDATAQKKIKGIAWLDDILPLSDLSSAIATI